MISWKITTFAIGQTTGLKQATILKVVMPEIKNKKGKSKQWNSAQRCRIHCFVLEKLGLPTFGVIDLNCCLSTYRAVCINYYITDNQYRSIHGNWNLIR